VVIDDKLELDLTSPPRVGEMFGWGGEPRRVKTVTWYVPTVNGYGQVPTGKDVTVYVELEKDAPQTPR
jgi:hypothetical protein